MSKIEALLQEMPNSNQAPTSKELVSDQEVRWCPGCGDYSILKQMQTVLPALGIPKEKIVFVSGIGCSSRFPYYMDTYGLHSIHGRATAVASGLKITRPDLNVWVITGDGDALSIGGNHTMHTLRRNVDLKILLFNNEIYGLTKGQYSPTSEQGKITKSTPVGSPDYPFNPMALALGADATFLARSLDRDPKHLQDVLTRAATHKGASFVEIYQNCNVFNDGAFEIFTDKGSKSVSTISVQHGAPLVFGNAKEWGIRLNGHKPEIVSLTDGTYGLNDLWIHDETDYFKASILVRMFDTPELNQEIGTYMPRPVGVLYAINKPTYDELVQQQLNKQVEAKGVGDLDALLRGNETWVVR